MHSAAKAGYLNVVKLLVESGASSTAETGNGRIPLWYAAAEGNLAVVSYLIHQNHDSYALLGDRKVKDLHLRKNVMFKLTLGLVFQFIFYLMTCGKKSDNAPTEEFILASPAPVDVAAKISALYRELSVRVGRLLCTIPSYRFISAFNLGKRARLRPDAGLQILRGNLQRAG